MISGCIAGYPFSLYKKNHSRHHIYTGTINDSEYDNFVNFNVSQSVSNQFICKILKSIFLIDFMTLLYSLFKSISGIRKNNKEPIYLYLLSMIVQLFFLNIFNDNNSLMFLVEAMFLMLLSVGSITFTLNRIRGMCEHSITKELEYTNYTRSHKKNYLTFLIAPFNFNFHVEHHLFPELSSGNYPAINESLCKIIPNMKWHSKSYLFTINKFL
jgi:fatty acid desaturase